MRTKAGGGLRKKELFFKYLNICDVENSLLATDKIMDMREGCWSGTVRTVLTSKLQVAFPWRYLRASPAGTYVQKVLL